MKKFLCAVVALAASMVATQSTNAALVSYFNFNSLSIATASAPGSGGVPTSISASSGTGTLSLSGWAGTVDDFAGSTLNALGGDPAEESLSLISAGPSGGPFPGNGSFIQIQTSMTGLTDAVISFATRGTSSGFNSGIWSWSTDGTSFTPVAGSTATTGTTFVVATKSFAGITALANAPTAFFRYTLSGATSNSGNNRIDNLQINADLIPVAPVPEPMSMAYASVLAASVGVGAWRRRRNGLKKDQVSEETAA